MSYPRGAVEASLFFSPSLPFSITSSDSVQCVTLAVASRWQHSLSTDLTCFFFCFFCWYGQTVYHGMTEQGRHPNIPTVCVCVAAVLQCSPFLALCLLVFVLEEALGEIRKNKAVERGFRPLIPVSLVCRLRDTLPGIQETKNKKTKKTGLG